MCLQGASYVFHIISSKRCAVLRCCTLRYSIRWSSRGGRGTALELELTPLCTFTGLTCVLTGSAPTTNPSVTPTSSSSFTSVCISITQAWPSQRYLTRQVCWVLDVLPGGRVKVAAFLGGMGASNNALSNGFIHMVHFTCC